MTPEKIIKRKKRPSKTSYEMGERRKCIRCLRLVAMEMVKKELCVFCREELHTNFCRKNKHLFKRETLFMKEKFICEICTARAGKDEFCYKTKILHLFLPFDARLEPRPIVTMHCIHCFTSYLLPVSKTVEKLRILPLTEPKNVL